MIDELYVMYTAVVISDGVMLVAAEPINDLVNKHPSFEILALSFLLLIGVFAHSIEKIFIRKIGPGFNSSSSWKNQSELFTLRCCCPVEI